MDRYSSPMTTMPIPHKFMVCRCSRTKDCTLVCLDLCSSLFSLRRVFGRQTPRSAGRLYQNDRATVGLELGLGELDQASTTRADHRARSSGHMGCRHDRHCASTGGRGDELWFYYGGTDKVHDEPRTKAAIGLAKLRLDGFCSMSHRLQGTSQHRRKVG